MKKVLEGDNFSPLKAATKKISGGLEMSLKILLGLPWEGISGVFLVPPLKVRDLESN